MATFCFVRVSILAAVFVFPLVAMDSRDSCRDEIENKMVEYAKTHHNDNIGESLFKSDHNGDGRLTVDEVLEAMKLAGVGPNCLHPEGIIEHLDKDNDGHLQRSEL
eukprot:TRINITY_DN13302_c0_g1_i1.p2 TRINITY_DN13302_c0_g1~~TRINITY_DN13302_c0_g1_i1.p2  ORF type:complete len:106 (+),score=20.36 TRINITY_DN13302_c0_g1_i1:156-473(+)